MFLIYLALWIIFNGRFTWEIFFIGLFVAAGMDYFSIKHLGFRPKDTITVLFRIPKIIKYLIILFIEIIKANVYVIKLIYSVSEEPEPRVVHFSSGLKTKTANVVLANSITLTPGTITSEVEDGNFTVHALDKDLAEDLDDSIFIRQLKEMEKGV